MYICIHFIFSIKSIKLLINYQIFITKVVRDIEITYKTFNDTCQSSNITKIVNLKYIFIIYNTILHILLYLI